MLCSHVPATNRIDIDTVDNQNSFDHSEEVFESSIYLNVLF